MTSPLQSERAAAEPKGWKLVPTEATMKMLQAGSAAAQGLGSPLTRTECSYNAMLAASPQPPAASAVHEKDELWDDIMSYAEHGRTPTPERMKGWAFHVRRIRAAIAAVPQAAEPPEQAWQRGYMAGRDAPDATPPSQEPSVLTEALELGRDFAVEYLCELETKYAGRDIRGRIAQAMDDLAKIEAALASQKGKKK